MTKTILFDQHEAVLGADFVIADDFYRLYIRFDGDQKREIILNNEKITQIKQIQKLFHTEFLSADILHIFQKEADFRRRDLDRFCSLYVNVYRETLQKYEQLLRQKNKELKGNKNQALLDLFNEQLHEKSIFLVQARQNTLRLIAEKMYVLSTA